ncbi:MAG: aminopeptidase P family protein [Actinomycetota bacterium]|nr:aminopeptidase P family protein [Actinomycetota bacterium]
MTTLLLHDVALRDPFLRHEIGEPAGDPLTFIEHDGRRIVVASIFEEDIFSRREDVVDEFWSMQELGYDDLLRDESLPQSLVRAEVVLRALQRVSAQRLTVPATFPVLLAQYLTDKGLELTVDEELWWARRRQKTPGELEGIERAQRAAETAMLAAARMLREAEPTRDGQLRFEGEIVTAEWIREAMEQELLSQQTDCHDLLVQSGAAGMRGHDPGMGPILPNETCIIDVWPRDMRSGAYSDMTRTFVPGRPRAEVQRLHAHCREALGVALKAVRPGASDVHARVSELFRDKGHPTQLHHSGEGPIREGFTHSLGHGVGLEVHERPNIGRRSDELVEGDVITLEPGLYYEGVGGVRLEDTVIVTAEGPEHLTDPFSYDLEP